jgi:hypothetical protein
VASLGKALVESEANGLVKLVAAAGSGEILGGHLAGMAAGEVIHEVVAAMAAHATVRNLAEAIHAFLRRGGQIGGPAMGGRPPLRSTCRKDTHCGTDASE